MGNGFVLNWVWIVEDATSAFILSCFEKPALIAFQFLDVNDSIGLIIIIIIIIIIYTCIAPFS